MDRDRRLSLTVGGFALAALAALVVAILSLSAQQGIFQARYRLVAYFDNVQGLVSGAAVRLAGTQVGQVGSVDLSVRPGGEPAVKVMLQVDEEVQQRIRADSVALITTVGLLGDQIVEISIGTRSGTSDPSCANDSPTPDNVAKSDAAIVKRIFLILIFLLLIIVMVIHRVPIATPITISIVNDRLIAGGKGIFASLRGADICQNGNCCQATFARGRI